VKAAFGQRRKMVRNSVKSIGAKGMDLNDPVFNKRPEQMPLEDFIHLTEILDTHGLQ
jgi:16S rRNA (adenine1518-N6/adenine1519-N6)-dimethyltransferase